MKTRPSTLHKTGQQEHSGWPEWPGRHGVGAAPRLRAAACLLLTAGAGLLAASCASQDGQIVARTPVATAAGGVPASGHAATPDPSKAEVRLPAAEGWQASLVIDNGQVGIWTTGTLKVFPQYGCPEIFGLDDKGHCILLSSYSGKWTPYQTVEDGAWLGALQQLDLDPRVPGPEIYTGGKRGNLFQIVPLTGGGFDVTTIARWPAQEIHTLVGGELLPDRAGRELLAFTRDGEVFDIRPEAGGDGFLTSSLAQLGTRVRQAVILPARVGEPPFIAAACRNGEVLVLRLGEDGLERRAILKEPMGLGRMALRRGAPGEQQVLYVTRDDGLLLRLEGRPEPGAAWTREAIYAGPQGLRGVAAGRFDADPAVETVAVFGYSHKLQLLSRREGTPWIVETLFTDRDKGHWLASAELDGRNATDELIASGYGARIVLLSRAPGTGLDGVATDPDGDPGSPAPR